ncbi:hypothetical protein [Rosistilla carotiformis]|uniref:hypothetical protein n=1 Tax=Rosistilla carotiformis TaxID=2528017 RepID=UPI0018D22D52|nr:hypothetical protein [Rosistilla carotiformis]
MEAELLCRFRSLPPAGRAKLLSVASDLGAAQDEGAVVTGGRVDAIGKQAKTPG